MNKILVGLLSLSIVYVTLERYDGGSLAPVIMSGSIIKNIGVEIIKKYPRKDCPVCKGKGWYLSGDGIEKVPCGYCKPESSTPAASVSSETKNSCSNPNCKCKNCKCKKCGCLPSVE